MGNSTVILIIFVFCALVFLVICFIVGSAIKHSSKEKITAKKELEAAQHKLKVTKEQIKQQIEQTANREIANIESAKYKAQAERLKELYKDLQKDLQDIERRIRNIRGE